MHSKLIACLFYIFILFWPHLSCNRSNSFGFLHVESANNGTYEIYKVIGDTTLQFVSEKVGQFNKDLKLTPGSYLILADCSHQIVIIHPGETSKLIAHTVKFIPTHPPKDDDIFSIQCSRYEKSHLRQHISNRYTFHMVSKVKDLLVGMQSLKIDFPSKAQKPLNLEFKLSSIKVNNFKGNQPSHISPYFVSPAKGLLSITQAQKFDKWQFLLAGDYIISLNGTKLKATLKESEALIIEPAGLRVNSPAKVDLSLIPQIKGSPIALEINGPHELEINQIYPVLPGQASIRLEGSRELTMIDLEEQKLTELNSKSLHIHLGCSPWEWECLGKREVNLYEGKKLYPLMDSMTDMPILHLSDDLFVGIEGSPGLLYKVPSSKASVHLHVGKVVFTPKPIHKAGQYTDLVRLEAIHQPQVGYSYDILPEQASTMTLFTGYYALVRYISYSSPDIERSTSKQFIQVRPGKTTYVEVPYYLSESKVKAINKTLTEKRDRDRLKLSRFKEDNKEIKLF